MRGYVYRFVMRVIHHLGWCYPQPVAIQEGFVWCHWCGMRGQRVTRPVTPVPLRGLHTTRRGDLGGAA